MTIAITSNGLIIQGGGAAPRPTTTSQNPTTSDQDLQNAARDLRQAIRNNINQQVIAQRAQGARAAAQAAADATPPPTPAGRFTIQGPDGRQTYIGVPPFARDTMPPEAVNISIAFFVTVAIIIIGLPLARAFARRMDRRGGPAQIPNEISSQLTHLNQAVDAIALEVERISEGQRFTTRLLSEQRDAARQTLPSGVDR